MGALDERGLVDALADFFGMPVTDLRRDTPDPEALALVPEVIVRENLAIPIRVDDDGLHVAVAQPNDDLRGDPEHLRNVRCAGPPARCQMTWAWLMWPAPPAR